MSRPGKGLVRDRAREIVLQRLVGTSGVTVSRLTRLSGLAIRAKAITIGDKVRWPQGLTIYLPSEQEHDLGTILDAEREGFARQIARSAARGYPEPRLTVEILIDRDLTAPYELQVHQIYGALEPDAVTVNLAEGDSDIPTVEYSPTECMTEVETSTWVLRTRDGKTLKVPTSGLRVGRGMSAASWLNDSRISASGP